MQVQPKDAKESGVASNGPQTADDLPALPASVAEDPALPAKPAAQPGSNTLTVPPELLGAPLSELAAPNGPKPANGPPPADSLGGCAMQFHLRMHTWHIHACS